MKEINITGKKGAGLKTLIDERDIKKIPNYAINLNGWGYPCITFREKNKRITKSLHQIIMGEIPKGMVIDHIDGNPLNNQKSNLRICTPQQNQFNQRKTRGVSKYKGVSWYKNYKKWMAKIKFNGRTYNLGYFNTEIQAAKAYDEKAKEIFGEFANLNKVFNLK